jgi:CheY-like chemotaxis protein
MFDGDLWVSGQSKSTPWGGPAPGDDGAAATAGKRIMVIEDDAIVSMAMENLLAEAGYVVLTTCARGEDAIAAIERQAPDLVLADVKLAGAMDGVEAAAAIRARRDVPIIFVTAHTDPVTRERMRAVGPADILAKPVPDFLLVRAVAAALGG